jgi:DNA-binding NtrC family response regulator
MQTLRANDGLSLHQTYEIKREIGDSLSFIAASSPMRKMLSRVELLAKVDVPILIVGESGSGKEIVARLIHKLSDRSDSKFLKVSCAALAPDVLDQLLFDERVPGSLEKGGTEVNLFSLCKHGTLLLKDIEELPPRTQAKLLCLLQDKQLIGSQNAANADVRIVVSTSLNLGPALLSKMRKELYYCLTAFSVVIPPLRHRREEIPFLLQHVMDRVAATYGLPTREFSPAILRNCERYSWPGNLRELEQFVKRYVISGEDDAFSDYKEAITVHHQAWPEDPTPAESEVFESESDTTNLKSLLHSAKAEAERNAISIALAQTNWNRTAAAKILHVSYRSLLYKIQQYEMTPPK